MIYTEAGPAVQTELGADLWAEDYSYVPAGSPSSCAVRFCRAPRSRMVWVGADGSVSSLMVRDDGSQFLRTVATGKKPYKPVRGIRLPRPTGTA